MFRPPVSLPISAAAVNATVKQVDETAEAEMGKLTGGMNIPGL